jgi:hypothetical protein
VAVAETDAIGTAPEEYFGVEEICATKAPRTTTRKLTTKRSFQPCFVTLNCRGFWFGVVMALSVPRSGSNPFAVLEAAARKM